MNSLHNFFLTFDVVTLIVSSHHISVPQTECSYTFLVPKQEDNSCPAWPVPSRPDDEEMEYLKSLVKLLTKNVQTLQEEVGALKEAQNGSCSNGDIRVGTNYVRWGRTVCPQTAQLVYQGLIRKFQI